MIPLLLLLLATPPRPLTPMEAQAPALISHSKCLAKCRAEHKMKNGSECDRPSKDPCRPKILKCAAACNEPATKPKPKRKGKVAHAK